MAMVGASGTGAATGLSVAVGAGFRNLASTKPWMSAPLRLVSTSTKFFRFLPAARTTCPSGSFAITFDAGAPAGVIGSRRTSAIDSRTSTSKNAPVAVTGAGGSTGARPGSGVGSSGATPSTDTVFERRRKSDTASP